MEAERKEILKRGSNSVTIVEPTSGNTGIAYALIGATLGYRVLLAMPANASPERKRILKSYGAELLLTDALQGPDGAIKAIRDLHRGTPEKFFYPDQYNNDANWRAHYDTTAPDGTIGIGNGATVTGSSQVQLALNSSDANGVTRMRFSSDGITWTDEAQVIQTEHVGLDGLRVSSDHRDGQLVFFSFSEPVAHFMECVASSTELPRFHCRYTLCG